jgi:CheY-like chemotaxis protein
VPWLFTNCHVLKKMYMLPLRSILHIEDDAEDLALVTSILRYLAPEVRIVTARDGLEGLDKLTRWQGDLPDLMLLDHHMPRLGGFEVLERVRANPAYREMPIIFTTTSSLVADKERALSLGANAFLTWPSNPVDTVAKLAALLGIERTWTKADVDRIYDEAGW